MTSETFKILMIGLVAMVGLLAIAGFAGSVIGSTQVANVEQPVVEQAPVVEDTPAPVAVPTTYRTVKPTQAPPTIQLTLVTNEHIKYGWTEVQGTVINNDYSAHDVSIYVDFYDGAGVKIDHVLDFVSVDGKGKSTFDCTTTKTGAQTARWYVDSVY